MHMRVIHGSDGRYRIQKQFFGMWKSVDKPWSSVPFVFESKDEARQALAEMRQRIQERRARWVRWFGIRRFAE